MVRSFNGHQLLFGYFLNHRSDRIRLGNNRNVQTQCLYQSQTTHKRHDVARRCLTKPKANCLSSEVDNNEGDKAHMRVRELEEDVANRMRQFAYLTTFHV